MAAIVANNEQARDNDAECNGGSETGKKIRKIDREIQKREIEENVRSDDEHSAPERFGTEGNG